MAMDNAYRTLLVEDEPGTRLIYQAILRRRGHEVIACASAEEALETCRHQSFGLAVLDWVLPGMSGLELCDKIRSLSWGDQTVILVVTGHDQPEVLQEALDAGADDYLTKPVDAKLFGLRMTIAESRLEGRIERNRIETDRERLQQLLGTILNSLSNPLYVIDVENYKVILANPAAGQLPDSHGMCCYTLTHGCSEPCGGAEHPCPLQEVQRTGQPVVVEHIHNMDGEERIVEIHASPLRDAEGRITHMVEICLDVTERKKAEEQLKASEENLQQAHNELELRVEERTSELRKLKDFSENILFNMAEGVMLTDKEGLFTFVNPAVASMLGYQSPEEFVGRSWKTIVPPDQVRLGEAAEERRARGQSDSYDIDLLHTDGARIPCQISCTPQFEQQNYSGSLCVLTNLSERRKSEAERALLSTAIEQANDAVTITDIDGTILYVNSAFEQMTGYSQQQAIGRTPAILKSGQQNNAFYRELWDTVLAGKVWQGHFVNRRADGTHYEEDAAIYPVTDESGKITSFVALKRDVSEEMLLQRRSQHARKMETLGELASGVAHDFNNLIMVIQSSVELLRLADYADEHISQTISVVGRATHSAAQLTRSLLGFSRQQILTLKSMDFNEFLAGVLPLLQRLLPDDIEIEFRPGPDIRCINGDQTFLEQVIFNLCNNSVYAMPEGGRITIKTTCVTINESHVQTHSWAQEGPYVMLSVTDEGIGMDEATRQRVLDPFFTTKEAGEGTGLGLSSAYGTIKQHRGWIDIESEPGVGTTISAYLPIADAPVTVRDHAERKGAQPRGGGETLLVVEDNPDLRSILVTLLESEGYRAQPAGDGLEALDILRGTNEVALVITDVNMPRMGGKELYHRSRELLPELRFIFCSGNLMEWEQLGCSDDAWASYMEKPFDLDLLAQRVREILDRSREKYD